MARLLAVLCTPRTKGYTAGLWREAAGAARRLTGVDVEAVSLKDFTFSPCQSCYACIRSDRHVCPLPDDMGRAGRGRLFRRVAAAHALLIVEPVHFWGNSAAAHLFIERLYPFAWSGHLDGMPFGSISCAANQGMQHLAAEGLCKWAFTLSMRHVGGVGAHAADWRGALRAARGLGRRLARAALRDARGRRRWPGELARYRAYRQKLWDPYPHYLANLTAGGDDRGESLIARAGASGEFTRPDARALLAEAGEELKSCRRAERAGGEAEALRHLVKAGALWTHATWRQLLEEEVIGAATPAAYRPLDP
jgi:multimeric flavodoxin WrbA